MNQQEEVKQLSQIGCANSAPSSAHNSNHKKSRKGNGGSLKKQGDSFSLARDTEKFNQLAEKYKEISGVSDWIQKKKQETEKIGLPMKKTTANEWPLQHQWKPPRIDPDKYQVPQFNQGRNDSIKQADPLPNRLQSTSLKKRRLRSLSFDEQQQKNPLGKRPKLDETSQSSASEIKEQIKQQQAIPNTTSQDMKLVYDIDKIADAEKLQDYMGLADFIMRETHNQYCNGLWLKGSMSGYQEKALKLLHSYDYNYNLAKFHILYPTIMAIPEQREEILQSLNEQELERIVNEAIIDMRGCKSQEAEEAIAGMRNDMNHNRINLEELGHYQQMLKKLRVEIPQDVEEELQKSREFSKLVKKKCGPITGAGAAAQIPTDKKMKFEEILALQEESLGFKIITPEMQQLLDSVRRSQQWIEKAEQIKDQTVTVKQLQNLLQEARSIPVNFEQLMENLKKRSNDSQQLVDKIHTQFIKVNKTRTQVNQQEQLSSTSKKKAEISQQQQQHHQHKKDKKQKEMQFKQLIEEAEELKITNPEIQKLREHLQDVTQWKNRVYLFLEDEQEQKERKEVFQQLLRETALFKFEVDLIDDLQRRLEFIEWHEKVEKMWENINQKQQLINQEEIKGEAQDIIMQVEKIPLHKLQALMQEGENKGFSEYPITNIQKLGELCIKANQFETDIRKVVKDIKDATLTNKESKPKASLDQLLELQQEGESLNVGLQELEELTKIIKEVKEFENRCQGILEQAEAQIQSLGEESHKFLKEVLSMRSQLNKIGVWNHTFQRYKRMVKPLLRWIKYSRSLIKAYYKSALQENQAFSHLNLLDQQDYESESSSDEQQLQQHAIPDKDYTLLLFLLDQAYISLKLLQNTQDFSILKQIEGKVIEWIKQADELESLKHLEKINQVDLIEQEEEKVQQIHGINKDDDKVEQQEKAKEQVQEHSLIVENLEKLVNEYLPLPVDKQQNVQKQLRRERWLKRLREVYSAEKVKIKQLETLAKDSNHADIQEDQKCKLSAESLKAQLLKCKEWLQVQSQSDLSQHKDILNLLDQGNLLKVNLWDYVDLKKIYQEVIDWKSKTNNILSGQKKSEYNYEILRKHIDAGIQDINDKELEVLASLVEHCAHWKSLAWKILKSREICVLQHQTPVNASKNLGNSQINSQNSQLSQSEPLCLILDKNMRGLYSLIQVKGLQVQFAKQLKQPEYLDNNQYCICRRGDDGMAFMIECDSCKEWFHGDCVGISKQIGVKLDKYICIGCAKLKFNYDYQLSQLHQFSGKEEQSRPEIKNLDLFYQQKRVNYQTFKALIEEGDTIPIYLEELKELKYIENRIENWFDNVIPFLDQEQFSSDYSSPVDKYPSQIINQQTTSLFKLFLESQSFPVELPEVEVLVSIFKRRQWYIEALIVLQNQQQKQNKVQYKKNVKRLLNQAKEMNFTNDQQLASLERKLALLLQGMANTSAGLMQNSPKLQQNPLPGQSHFTQHHHSHFPHQQQAYQSGQVYGGMQGNSSVAISSVEEQLNALFAQGTFEYGDCVNLIEHFEMNKMIQSEEDAKQVEELKGLLTEYTSWLSQVRECLNHTKKHDTISEFEILMNDGEKLYWMITSVERLQYQQIQSQYYEWVQNAQGILDQIEQNFNNNPETQKYQVIFIFEVMVNQQSDQILDLLQVYKRNLPFYSLLADQLEDKYKQLTNDYQEPHLQQQQQHIQQIDQQSQRIGVQIPEEEFGIIQRDHNLSNNILHQNEENTHDFFK